MSYIYTTAEEMSRTGLPMMRPLFLEFPNASKDGHPLDLTTNNEFMLGPDLLIAPSPYPDQLDNYDAVLPPVGWYNYWTGEHLKSKRRSRPRRYDTAGDSDLLIKLHPSIALLAARLRPR